VDLHGVALGEVALEQPQRKIGWCQLSLGCGCNGSGPCK
jgi:hypothetical protein